MNLIVFAVFQPLVDICNQAALKLQVFGNELSLIPLPKVIKFHWNFARPLGRLLRLPPHTA